MADLSPEGRARQAELTRRYLSSLPEKRSRIQALWRDAERGGWQAAEMRELSVQVHRLAGSAGSYGLDHLGQAAARLEAVLKSVAKPGTKGDSGAPLARALLQDLLAEFEKAAGFGGAAPPD